MFESIGVPIELPVRISYMGTLGDRLKELGREMDRGWQASLARYCGVRPPSVADWISGKTKTLEGENLLRAAEFFKVNPNWLASGKGRKFIGSHSAQEPLAAYDNDERELTIPQYAAGGAMGNGLVLEEKQPGIIKSWRVDEEWLRLNVRHHTGVQNLCIVTGFGPSMKPKYNPGDPLLLDRGVSTVETEGIYFFRVENHGFIKQLQRIPTEAGMVIRAKSLNPSYDPFDITGRMDFEVFGKVLTVWKSEQV